VSVGFNYSYAGTVERDGETLYRCRADRRLDTAPPPFVAPPNGTATVLVTGDGVVSAPDGAVLSFGVERGVEPPDGPVTPEAMYGRFCPYSKAFASHDEYDQWVEANPRVVSDVQPLDESLDLQARLMADADSLGDGDTTESRDSTGDGCSC